MDTEYIDIEPFDIQEVLARNFSNDQLGHLYKVGDQFVFAIYGTTSLSSYFACYLINRIGQRDYHRTKWFRHCIEFTRSMSEDEIVNKFKKALEVPLDRYLQFDADGGDLGREKDNLVAV